MAPETPRAFAAGQNGPNRSLKFRFSRQVKPFIPARVKKFLWRRRFDRYSSAIEGKSSPEIFRAIYAEDIWGGSGSGSHLPHIVHPYCASVAEFASTFAKPIDAVDLGCGDFAVGSMVRSLFGNYVAGDVVPEIIEQNRRKYRDLNVDFRVIDMVKDVLPAGDVVFIRQVFQHLSNAEISMILKRVCSTYPRLILTEHLPAGPNFEPNIDIETGHGLRLHANSGIDIAYEPFNVRYRSARVLCDVRMQAGGDLGLPCDSRITTTLYEFEPAV